MPSQDVDQELSTWLHHHMPEAGPNVHKSCGGFQAAGSAVSAENGNSRAALPALGNQPQSALTPSSTDNGGNIACEGLSKIQTPGLYIVTIS